MGIFYNTSSRCPAGRRNDIMNAMKDISSEADFDRETSAAEGRLALFYSPWCPFCRAFLPVFEKCAAGRAPAFGVSTDDLPGPGDRFSVDVVPTVIFFRAGRAEARLDGELGRGLSEAGLVKFMKNCGIGA